MERVNFLYQFDTIIKNALVLDGTGKPAKKSDIAIKDGKIKKIGKISGERGKQLIDANGALVTPGFIDIHTHADVAIDRIPTAENYLFQGVTTVIGGNCGFFRKKEMAGEDYETVGSFLEKLENIKISLNFGTLEGYGHIRNKVCPEYSMELPEEGLSRMKELLKKAMEEGAFGISTGLQYLPDRYAQTEELIEMARIAGGYGGIYSSHIRDEGVKILNAVAEAIEIAKKSNTPVQISHIKACGVEVWGYGKILSSMINMAQALGLKVTADQYPYKAAYTGFSQIFPPEAHDGGKKMLIKRLNNPQQRPGLIRYAKKQITNRVGEDLSLIQISTYKSAPEREGKTIKDIMLDEGINYDIDHGVELIIKMYLEEDPSIIYHYVNEEDIKVLLRNPFIMICSDGEIIEYGVGSPHPRSYGSFPRVLAKYVREQQVITMEEAIRKMTLMPAKKLGLSDRGIIKEGYSADMVIFDKEKITDTASFKNPHRYGRGINYLLVNGEITIREGRLTGKKAGKVLYGPGKKTNY